MTLSVLNASLL